MKEHDVESCHAVFLDFSSMLEPAFEPLVTSTAANVMFLDYSAV